jgi:hypothetical protein
MKRNGKGNRKCNGRGQAPATCKARAMSPIASFHLVRFATTGAPRQLVTMPWQRHVLAHTDGLRFWRLLGTGRGSSTAPGADLRRWAIFAVWDDERHLYDFTERSPLGRRFSSTSQSWNVVMHAHGGHGTWRGFDVLGALPLVERHDGPLVAITRAQVRMRHWRTFAAAGRPVSAAAQGAHGLRAVAGIGEAPLGRQATVSVWDSMAHLQRFAYSDRAHADVVRRTREQRWYGEEMFARFVPLRSWGTWDGVDPVAHG